MRDNMLETANGFPEAPWGMFGSRFRIRCAPPVPKPIPPVRVPPVRVTPTPVPPSAKDPPITLASLKRKSSRVMTTVLTRK